MLFYNVKQVVSLLVRNFFAPGDAHHFALDAQNGRAVGELDVEVVAGQGKDLFFQDQSFWAAREELREDAHWGGDLGEVCHGGRFGVLS